MGLDSQNTSDYNTGLTADEFERSPEKYAYLGQPVLTYIPTFDKVNEVTKTEWRDEAVCKGLTSLFFAPNAESPSAKEKREAKAKQICDSCPVINECLEFANENVEFGYWAGTNEDDRRLIAGRYPRGYSKRVKKQAV